MPNWIYLPADARDSAHYRIFFPSRNLVMAKEGCHAKCGDKIHVLFIFYVTPYYLPYLNLRLCLLCWQEPTCFVSIISYNTIYQLKYVISYRFEMVKNVSK